MTAASNVITFGLLHMRPLQWWLRTTGFSPRGNPFRKIKVTRRCLRALDMWKKPWFLSKGPVLGAPCRRVMLTTNASLTGWGVVMSGCSAQGLWEDPHLTWHINWLEMLAGFQALKHYLPDLRDHHVLVRTDNTSVVSYINHQGGLRLPVDPRETALLVGSVHHWVPQSGSRHPVETGAEARGMDAPHRGDEADLEEVWSSPVGLVCISRDLTMSPLVLSDSSSSTGTDVAEALSVRLPRPIALLPGVLERVHRDDVQLLLVAPYWPGRPWFADPVGLLEDSPWEIPVRRDLLSQAGGTIFHPRPELWKLWVWPLPDGAHFIATGLSTEVVETILKYRVPSTRKSYAAKWQLFTSWCHSHQLDTVECPIGKWRKMT